MQAIALEYHDVVDPAKPDSSGFSGNGPASYKLAPEDFAAHLKAIGAGPAGSRIARVDDPDRRAQPVFITFDDGGVSAHTTIADLLEEHGWSGHFMVTSNFVDTPTFLSSSQLRDLRARGHVISAHSASHPQRMAACSYETILDEWRRSVGTLSDILGEAVVSASVPGGLYLPKVARAAAQAGLTHLFNSEPTSTVTSVDGCEVLGRYSIRSWTSAAEAARLAEGRVGPRLKQWGKLKAMKTARFVGGPAYLWFRNFYWERIRGRD